VLKVLYRNSGRIQEADASQKDALHPVAAAKMLDPKRGGELVREAVRGVNWDFAESRFAAVANGPSGEAFNHLQYSIQDEVDVHRVVLSWRAYSMLDLTGQQHAHSLLRQSVRYCLRSEENQKKNKRSPNAVRDVLPRLLDEHKLLAKPLGNRKLDDAWVEHLADTIFASTREQAAEAVAAALAEGMSTEAVGEALSLAANKLVLHDLGRLKKYSSPQKPAGCVHGDSVGVHASDAANAWRHIAKVSNPRNTVASLIVGAYHTTGQIHWAGKKPYPFAQETSNGKLLSQLEAAIKTNDQARACCRDSLRQREPARPTDLRLAIEIRRESGRGLACREVLSDGH
jgi:hypothetical protein